MATRKTKTDATETPKRTRKKTENPPPPSKSGMVSLVTGFPGFLATHLLLELCQRQPDAVFYFLVQPKFETQAEARIARLHRECPEFKGEFHIVHGDITGPKLGLTDTEYDALRRKVTHVWHLAAIYDLAVSEEVAYRVNVRGTAHVLDFCEGCTSLKQLNYVSTCYVSGRRTGKILEIELDEGQAHFNHYESTKFWAEMEVTRRMASIPTAIFRPAIVVGHSRTGETDKYDGPYYLLKIINKMPRWLPFMNVGRGDTVVNIVPVDFAAAAIAYLGLQDVQGQVFQVADPNPMRARDIVSLGLRCLGKAPAVGMIPPTLARKALNNETVERTLGIPRQLIGYFTHDARYDVGNTARALQGTKIRCPHLSTYMQNLVDFYEAHPDLGFADGRTR